MTFFIFVLKVAAANAVLALIGWLFYLWVEHCCPGGWDNDPPNTGPE